MKFIPFLILLPLLVQAESLPFWTEKASYVEGDRLYAVGVSGVHKTQAAAREEAFEKAKVELQKHLQIQDLSALEINTQMNYDQEVTSGKRTYRLLWVSQKKALVAKKLQKKKHIKQRSEVGTWYVGNILDGVCTAMQNISIEKYIGWARNIKGRNYTYAQLFMHENFNVLLDAGGETNLLWAKSLKVCQMGLPYARIRTAFAIVQKEFAGRPKKQNKTKFSVSKRWLEVYNDFSNTKLDLSSFEQLARQIVQVSIDPGFFNLTLDVMRQEVKITKLYKEWKKKQDEKEIQALLAKFQAFQKKKKKTN